MVSSISFVELRNILAELYSDEDSARRVVTDASLDAKRIRFSGSAINIWNSILTEARNTENIVQLLDVILSDFVDNSDLRAACEDFRRFSEHTGKPVVDEDAPAPGDPPYKGLQPYDIADANRFFGREQWIPELVGHLRDGYRFLAVIGPSGSGKSSLVRAGLIPALQQTTPLADGTLPPRGSDRWIPHIITPTKSPLESLAGSLVLLDEQGRRQVIDQIIDEIKVEPSNIDRHMRRFISQHGEGDHLLLIVDEFEEVFTLCKNHPERQMFIDILMTAAVKDGASTVVIVLRADFYQRCAEFDKLRIAMEHNQCDIDTMSKDELRAAIEKSAQFGGWELQPGLVDFLLNDAATEPGALPLVSHALLATWEQRHRRELTITGYIKSGGIRRAIANTAESLYQQVKLEEKQKIIRNVFLRLTELGEGNEDTRRRVGRNELTQIGMDVQSIEDLLAKLAKARLITVHQDKVEVAHEALIREWPRLRGWLEKDREWLRIHRRLTEATIAWKEMNCEPSDLYRGTRLDQILEWTAYHADDLNKAEQDFLDASSAERQRVIEEQKRIEQERADAQHRELIQTRRARNRAWAAFSAVVVALLLAVVVGWQLYDQNRKSQVERLLSEARELKMALQPNDAIAKLKAAEEVAKQSGVNLNIVVSTEINDVERYVTAQWVQQGEQLVVQGNHAGALVWFRKALALNPPSDLPVYIWIGPGEFVMGSGENEVGYDEENPQHTLYLDGYWIMRTEVTTELYARCVREGHCTVPANEHWDKPQFAHRPVTGVDWNQANTYARWIGGRLPTEAEWEKACRGTDGRIYPWGNEAPSSDRLNYTHSKIRETTWVGSYSAGANGLYDMAGNALEWTNSKYDLYPYNPNDGRENPKPNDLQVLRGGAFNFDEPDVRCAFRTRTSRDLSDNYVGFRVVLPGH